MVYLLNRESIHSFRNLIKHLSDEDVSRCYQCGKCTAGCPVAVDMDISPNQVMRLVQINHRDRVLGSSTIWLCLSCETCTTRCPEGIDIAKVMDTLRKVSVAEGYRVPERTITEFNRAFLDSVERHGRLNELEFALRYNLALRQPFKDMAMGLNLLRKGKMNLFGENIAGRSQLKGIFNRSKRFIKGRDR